MNPKLPRHHQKWVLVTAGLICLIGTLYWGSFAMAKQKGKLPGIPPQQVADYVHAIIEADRTVYSTHVVDPLQKREFYGQANSGEIRIRYPCPPNSYRPLDG